MDIEHISVSRRSTWETCQEKYRLQYHEKIPSEVEHDYFLYGKIIHKIAEIYVERADKNRFMECVSDVLSGKIELEPGKEFKGLPSPYKNVFHQHLKSLKDFADMIGLNHEGFVEYRFEYDLDPPNNHNVTGFIDRIIQRNGKFFIIDYKTTKKGNWRKNKITILHDVQLRMYAKVIQKNFNVPASDVKCGLFYIDGGDYIGATYSQKDIDETEHLLRSCYYDILATPPEKAKGNVGDHCRRCEWRKHCRFWSLTGKIND